MGLDCTRWPTAAQPHTAKPRLATPSSVQPPPPYGPPAPSPAALFWLLLLGVHVCMQPALSIPSHFPPSLVFSDFPPSCSLVFYVLICPLTVSQPSDFFYPACLILPSVARHRGCKSAQQLLNWHVLHCLLTVLFLLDFIKTPSAVSSGMDEGVAEDEMEEERQWEKSEEFGGGMAQLTWRVQAATVVSCRRDTSSI